jgi:hypothetical protein
VAEKETADALHRKAPPLDVKTRKRQVCAAQAFALANSGIGTATSLTSFVGG